MRQNTLKIKDNNTVLELVEKHGVPYLEYPILNAVEIVNHGFSTRLGGVSSGIFDSMNLSFVRGDDEALVQENYSRISKAIGVKKENIVCSKQTHTDTVIIVGKEHAGNGVLYENKLEDVDGMITDVPGLCLATFYADCVPLFFVDPVKKVIGLSHSGWRGTVQKIGNVTIEKMHEYYGCSPTDIVAAIGPSICQDCYEVSEEVIDSFKENYDKQYWESLFYQKENSKYQLNLWKANEIVLLESGILPEHIAVTNLCTCCNPELLFSHRASEGKRGNLGAFLALKE
ncbi:MAG: peptidoglycan editing factor PgeF [Eubacteriales bacterium]